MWVYQAMAFLNLCEFIFHFIRTAPYSLTTKSLCDCTALNFQGQLVHIWKELQIFVNTWNLWSTSAFFDKGNICTHDCSLYDHQDHPHHHPQFQKYHHHHHSPDLMTIIKIMALTLMTMTLMLNKRTNGSGGADLRFVKKFTLSDF